MAFGNADLYSYLNIDEKESDSHTFKETSAHWQDYIRDQQNKSLC